MPSRRTEDGERVRGRHHGRPLQGRALGAAPPQPRGRSRAGSASRREAWRRRAPTGHAARALHGGGALPRRPRLQRALVRLPTRARSSAATRSRRLRLPASHVGSTTWVRAAIEPAPLSSIWPHAGGRDMPFLPSCSAELGLAPRGGHATPFLPSSAPPSPVSPYVGGYSTSFPPSSASVKSSKFQHLAFSPATAA
jgi:hypothetical protein